MRESHGRAVAVLVGQLRDFDLAEEAVQDAWVDALRTWGRDGPPDNPVAWIVTTARRRAVDRLRRRQRQDKLATSVGEELLSAPTPSWTGPPTTTSPTSASAWSSPAAIRRSHPSPV